MAIPSSLPSMTAQRTLNQNLILQADSMRKLSTGFRINTGADDPAGLIASENLRATLAALDAESRALQRSDQVLATADGALSEVSDLLADAEALAVANANTGGLSDAEREANQMQLDSIMKSVDRIANTTTFNGQKLLDGSASFTIAGENIDIASARPSDLGEVTDGAGATFDLADVASGGPISTLAGDPALAAASIRGAAQSIATLRGEIGAFSANIIAPAFRASGVAFENISAANSIIRDTNYAAETANQARLGTLTNAGFRVLSQANADAGRVLQLLG